MQTNVLFFFTQGEEFALPLSNWRGNRMKSNYIEVAHIEPKHKAKRRKHTSGQIRSERY